MSLGFCLWTPSVAISIGGIWGVQFILIFALIVLFILVSEGKIKNEFFGLIIISILSILLLLSTVFGVLPFSRGIFSYLSELTLLIVTFVIYTCIVRSPIITSYFISGFYFGALLSASIACVQFIGLNLNLNFFAWEIVNPSFSALGKEVFEYHQRSYVFTPEPSILSGLLLTAISLQVINVRLNGTHKNWIILGIFLFAMVTTASQGITFIPVSIVVGVWLTKSTNNNGRTFLYVMLFFLVAATSLLMIESLQRNFIIRLVEIFYDSGESSSYRERSEIIHAAFRMFVDHPILGAGPGSSESLEKYMRNNVPVSAVSALARNAAELGVVVLTIWCVSFWELIKAGNRVRRNGNIIHGQLVAIGLGFAIAAATFIGYRVLYQNSIWLGIALALFQLNRSQRQNKIGRP